MYQFSFSLYHMGRWKDLTAILSFRNDSPVANYYSTNNSWSVVIRTFCNLNIIPVLFAPISPYSSISRMSYPILHQKKYFLFFHFYALLAMSKYYIICKLYICILWIPFKDNDLLKWFWDMLSLNDELLYMQIYVETVKLKSKVLIFDYMKCISGLLIDWLIKSSSINWNDKIIDNNTTWRWWFQLRILSHS